MFKQLRPAIVSVLLFVILTGLVFPLAVTGIAQVAFRHQANGSLITGKDGVVGSELIGQNFSKPEYFHPRASAAGSGYDATNSGGTNLGPSSDKLIHGIHKKLPNGKDDPGNFDGVKDLRDAYIKENELPADAQVPADAVTRSASGLDPQISPANAQLQVKRVAKARDIPEDEVERLVRQNIQGRTLGFLGEPGVNVLTVNLALDKAAPVKSAPATK
jgi:K+-transporting ATPase ATPase C chain